MVSGVHLASSHRGSTIEIRGLRTLDLGYHKWKLYGSLRIPVSTRAAADSWACLRKHQSTSSNTMDSKPAFLAWKWSACVVGKGFARKPKSREGSNSSIRRCFPPPAHGQRNQCCGAWRRTCYTNNLSCQSARAAVMARDRVARAKGFRTTGGCWRTSHSSPPQQKMYEGRRKLHGKRGCKRDCVNGFSQGQKRRD